MGLATVMGVLFVVFPAVLFNGIARVKAAKAKTGGAGDALRMSELNVMIANAVERETTALRARIEVLEEIATSKHDDFRLPASTPLLALPDFDADQEGAGAAPPRATERS